MSEQEGSSKALATATLSSAFPILASKERAAELMEAIEANVGHSGEINGWSLDRIKVALGGGTTWEVPTIDGARPAAELRGIILHVEEGRGFWSSGEVDGSPPDCASRDRDRGYGRRWAEDDEGPHDCASCKWSQWGSKAEVDPRATDSRAQACAQKDHLFVLLEGEALPKVVQAPSGSLKNFRKYMLRLASAGIPRYGVVTAFRLEKDKNEAGQPFSRIEFAVAKNENGTPAVLSVEARQSVQAYIQALGGLLSTAQGNGQGSSL